VGWRAKGHEISMKKFIIPAVSVLVLAFVVAGCGKSTAGTSTPGGGGGACTKIEMAATTFVQSTCTIKAVANPNGPAELNTAGGVTFNGGDTKSYTFATAGTYEVTCTIHPDMNVTITVQ
jgi:plastocyanin